MTPNKMSNNQIFDQIWAKYGVLTQKPLKSGKVIYDGRNFYDSNNPPFWALVFRIPSHTWEKIQQIQASLEKIANNLEFFHPNHFHITLQEFGWEDKLLPHEHKLETSLKTLLEDFTPFKIRLYGVNCFVDTVIIQVFDEQHIFEQIVNKICSVFSIPPNHFDYVPHVSIAKCSEKTAALLKGIDENRHYSFGEVDVRQIELVRARPYLTVARVENKTIFRL